MVTMIHLDFETMQPAIDSRKVLSDDRVIVGMTLMLLAVFGLSSMASTMPGVSTNLIGDAAYFLTNSEAMSGGSMAGTGAVIGAGIQSSSLSGAYLAGAVGGGVLGVLAVGA
jgi:hypothetical protein